eukprot:CAMPEP_0174830068 /NCGR_PEP_ID=MMETSP1114-20130205/2319_1 /TAXON_ID=312471 /ORGANISM="Neobodo designis, Strain CCAP 1951/1" /LENGTH=743 /DNA_ID=CAMNT_0016063851 /DNA_START=42 /DNA_END=2273 /DNA_ORIENTATION=+
MAAEKHDEMPKLEVSGGLFDFAAAGWSDKLAELKAEAARIPPCTISLFSRVRIDDAIASPEALDKQTDMLMRDILPPSELIKTKAVKKASELSDAETVGVCDTLLSYFVQFCKGTPANISIETCFYAHEADFVKGHPLETFLNVLLKAMVHVSHVVDMSGVRDGDEEFSSSFLASSIGSTHGQTVELDITDAEAQAAKSGPLADRFKLLVAIFKYTMSNIRCLQHGAQAEKDGKSPKDDLSAAADALAAAATAVAGARAADAVAEPLGTVFTPHAAMWDTMGIPHVAVPPCQWGAAVAFYQEVAADARLVVDKWFPLRADILAVLDEVKAYAFREPAPTLLARATAAAFTVNGNHQPFGGEPILTSLVSLLATRFGAPWYGLFTRSVDDADKQMADTLLEYTHKAQAGASRNPAPIEETRRFVTLGTSTTLLETGRILCQLMVAYLRNRGRCHRVLVNMLPAINQCQQQAIQMERRAFSFHGMSSSPFVQQNPSVMLRQEVLLSLVSDLLMDTCQSICLLTQRLGLVTAPEIPSLLFYYQQLATSRNETLSYLHATDTACKEFRELAKRRGAPPTLAMRVPTAIPTGFAVRQEATMLFARPLQWALNILKDRVPALQLPKKSLQSLAHIFDHRFGQLQQLAQRNPLPPHKEIPHVPAAEASKVAQKIVEQFKMLVQRIQQVRPTVEADAELVRFLDAVEKAAKKNAVTVGLINRVPGYIAELTYDDAFPFVVTLNAVKAPAEE